MSVKERVEEVLNKEMDRKDFLRNAGLFVLAVTGVTNVMHAFDGRTAVVTRYKTVTNASAYGGSIYAGPKKK